MNITPSRLPPLPAAGAPAAPAPSTAALRAPCSPAPQSSLGAQLRSTHADFDAPRVAALRERIHNGSYCVNVDRVADGLLAHVRDFSAKS